VVETDVIKPANQSVTIDLSAKNDTYEVSSDSGQLAKLIIKGLEDKEVATIDAKGNATLSGTLSAKEATISGTVASNKVETNEASVSGKLTAKEIESQTIDELRNRLSSAASDSGQAKLTSEQLSNSVNEIQSLLAEIQNNPLPNPDSYQDLNSSSATTTTDSFTSLYANNLAFTQGAGQDLTLTGNLNAENAYVLNTLGVGNIFISDNEILTSAWELKLNALNSITDCP